MFSNTIENLHRCRHKARLDRTRSVIHNLKAVKTNNEFAALVLHWRIKRRLSQPDAALRLGVPYRTFQDWEYGRRSPRGLARQLITEKLRK